MAEVVLIYVSIFVVAYVGAYTGFFAVVVVSAGPPRGPIWKEYLHGIWALPALPFFVLWYRWQDRRKQRTALSRGDK